MASEGIKKHGFNIPRRCLVTGGSGFVGQRLVEMLVERGATRVVSFDISPRPKESSDRKEIVYIQGDLTKYDDVLNAARDTDCIFHIAALVGPYHPQDAYVRVNYQGTLNVLNASKELKIKRIVMSSSPSTRFPYPDPSVKGKSEQELFIINKGDYTPVFLQPYAETKAMGEKVILDACGNSEGDLLTIAVAPHQVYGPRDSLFLPSLLEAAGSGKLRIFGNGENLISFCHVDNYCHGLILGYEALRPDSPALGKFYIITDGQAIPFWKALDQAIVAMGFVSIWSKLKLPGFLMILVAHIVVLLGDLYAALTGTPKHVVNFHLKLNPFAVRMLLIDRYFDISAAKRDLHYEPLVDFQSGWADTIRWFQDHWLPGYRQKASSGAGKGR